MGINPNLAIAGMKNFTEDYLPFNCHPKVYKIKSLVKAVRVNYYSGAEI